MLYGEIRPQDRDPPGVYTRADAEGIISLLRELIRALTPDHRAGRIVITAMIAAGFAAGVAQVLLMRELLVIAYGNELSVGLLLACWLVAGAVGSIAARSILRGEDADDRSARLMVLLAMLPTVLLAGSICLCRAAPLLLTALDEVDSANAVVASLVRWLSTRPGEMLGPGQIALIGSLVALGPAALDGLQFAAGADLYSRAQSREAAGPAYAADAIGHLIGGVLLATAVVIMADPFTIALISGAVNLVAAGLLAHCFLGISKSSLRRGIAVASVMLVLAGTAARPLHDLSLRWRWHNHDPIASIESIHGNIALMRQQPDGIYVYQSGIYSGASPALPGTVEEVVHFTMLQHPNPRRVLLIGEGITGGLREVLKHEPERVDYVELDAALFEMAQRWAAPEDAEALADPRVNKIAGDGRRRIALAGSEGPRWDIILVALPDPATAQLNRFYTVEFYAQAAAALREGGVIGWQIPGSTGYFGSALLRLHRSLLATASAVFDQIVQMPGESAVVVGSRETPLTDDWKQLEERLRERGVESAWFDAMLPDRLDPSMLRAVKRTVSARTETDTGVAINTDLRPVGYFLDQTWWLTQFRPGAARVLSEVSVLRARHVLTPLVAGAMILLCLLWLRPVRTATVPLSVCASGFAAMTLQIVLIFTFQAIYGYVYHMVGVIIGSFMVGLAVGSVGAHRLLRSSLKGRARQGLPIALATIAVAALLLGPGLRAMAHAGPVSVVVQVIFPAITAIVGLTVGSIFPLAASAWEELPTSGACAWLYAADLVGAAGGAVLAGAFFAPVIGIPGTCTLAAVIATAAALLTGVRSLIK